MADELASAKQLMRRTLCLPTLCLPTLCLPMYDWPQVSQKNDHFCAALHENCKALGLDIASTMQRGVSDLFDVWQNPDLGLAQTCGFPFIRFLKGKVKYVGTPHYQVSGCEGPNYSSALVVKRDDTRISLSEFRQARFAYNEEISQSGFQAMRSEILLQTKSTDAREAPWFKDRLKTASHLASMEAVAQGHADIAAIDAVSFALACQHKSDVADKIRLLHYTQRTPGLPFITSLATSDEDLGKMRKAVKQTCDHFARSGQTCPATPVGFSVLDETEYGALDIAANAADHAGILR